MMPSAPPAGHPRHVPNAWPAMLSRDQLCAYIGVSEATLIKICPVTPRDLGANVVRYSRLDVDAWIESLPPRLVGSKKRRLPEPGSESQDKLAADTDAAIDLDRPTNALERVRGRAQGRGDRRWRKTG